MKNKAVLGMLMFSYFMCNYGGTFLSKDVQSVYVEDTVVGVGESIDMHWVNQPMWVIKDAEWQISDESIALMIVSEDKATATLQMLKEGNVIVSLKYGDEIVDSVELSVVNDSMSVDTITASMNGVSDIAISDFIKISNPEELHWVSSNEEVVAFEDNQRKYSFTPSGVGTATVQAYYGDQLIGDVEVCVNVEEALPAECIVSQENVCVLDSAQIYNRLSPEVVYDMGTIDASTYLGVVEGELVFKEKGCFGKGREELVLPSYSFALREGSEILTLKINDREYTIKVNVNGNDKSIIYKRWLKSWMSGIDMEASIMDKVMTAGRHMEQVVYDNKTYKIEDVVTTGKANTMGANALFLKLCRKMGVESETIRVNQEMIGKDRLELATGSSILNYYVTVVTDGEDKYILDVTPHEGEKPKCYKYADAENGIWTNIWESSENTQN